MKEEKSILVLLSSYNGEKFIGNQINSILGQEGVNVQLLIRDDGSTDSTIDIIKDFQERNKELIHLVKGENIGWRASFFSLMEHALHNFPDFEYYAFSDQDDIWLEDKLLSAVKVLSEVQMPIRLYCSSLYSFRNGETEGIIRREMIPTVKNCIIRNIATGCTIVFSKDLLEAMRGRTPRIMVPHDHWVYMVAALCGKIVVDSVPHILYRLHLNNQIGNKTGVIEIWKRRIENIRSPESYKYRESISKELLRLYSDLISEEGLVALQKIVKYKDTLASRMSLLFDSGYTMGNPINDIFVKLRIIAGIL